eukprot:TRINITY_DN5013_c0_g2_i9.p1 TRINITY_DN5013_c0_g2~~TRINITY_DN5013_c0_g2_i9.p1  ORF type:complete len:580 (-),score=105.02 TRINITY_DN5013_c0_g2_i9:503-2242(-)
MFSLQVTTSNTGANSSTTTPSSNTPTSQDTTTPTTTTTSQTSSTPSASTTANHATSPREQEEVISFFSGNPRVEITRGTIKLFRHRSEILGSNSSDNTPSNTSASASATSSSSHLPAGATWGRSASAAGGTSEQSQRSSMVCILAVPGSISGSDFCKFVAPFKDSIESMRILRENDAFQYMVAINLKSVSDAQKFIDHYHGKPFNSLQAEVCHAVYVKEVSLDSSSKSLQSHGLALVPDASSSSLSNGGGGGVATELPTCPVCLDRLDASVSGVLTIQCNHTFHCTCLSKWGDVTCPVCRYVQDPPSETSCEVCDSQDSLWICVVCGFVGCGRYSAGHAYAHFKDTRHAFSMELDSKRVWDYVGDNYVHRLVHKNDDGKVVEFSGFGAKDGDEETEMAKLSSITMQYDYLLTSQLEAQREYYESEIAKLKSEVKTALMEGEEGRTSLLAQNSELKNKCESSEKQAKAMKSLNTQLTKELKSAREELSFLKAVNESLTSNQQGWEEKLRFTQEEAARNDAAQHRQIQELEEQVRDLMFYVEGRNKIEATGEDIAADIAGGHIILPATPKEEKRKGKNRKR